MVNQVVELFKSGQLDAMTAMQMLGGLPGQGSGPTQPASSPAPPSDGDEAQHMAKLKARLRRLCEEKDMFIRTVEKTHGIKDSKKCKIDEGWYSRDEMLKDTNTAEINPDRRHITEFDNRLNASGNRGRETFKKFNDSVLQKTAKIRQLVSDLKRNYDDPLAVKSIATLEKDLETLDGVYAKCSQMWAEGEQSEWTRECTQVAQNEAKVLVPLPKPLRPMSEKEPTAQNGEASCRSQIRTARAVAEELGPANSVSGGVDAWAKICLNNSERDCSKVVLKQQGRLNVPISYLQIHGRELPWICPKDWVQYIIDRGLWHHLAGLDDAHRHQAGEVWRSFWDKIEAMHPELEVFNEEFNLDRENTAAIYVHGDEGRSLKKSAVMVTSVQSCLGIGFSDKLRGCKRTVDGTLKHEINYRGHTYTTRFVSSIIPKRIYESDPEFYHKVMESTVGSLMETLTRSYRAYCRSAHLQPIVTKLTTTLLSFTDPKGPVGAWHKGALTSNLLKWLGNWLADLRPAHGDLLYHALQGTNQLNKMFSYLYRSPFFFEQGRL
ncbi:unnamed protein product [Durusdinium trenchii]|uniref:Uncharacterized protein n=1 Tax=Durusdinium trenchii TaxID=1381693 RepID=A0ABP0MB62_9DINO